MKLKLDKQKVTTLSSKELGEVNGGGYRRSARKNGNCNYSDDNKKVATFMIDGVPDTKLVGCNTKSLATTSVSGTSPTRVTMSAITFAF